MSAVLSVITIGIDPTIEVGPVEIAWHGLTIAIAIGIVIGGIAVAHDARRRGLEPERVYAIGMILVIGALVGGRAFYLLEHGHLDDPGAWLGSTGFTFYGGFIAAAPRHRLLHPPPAAEPLLPRRDRGGPAARSRDRPHRRRGQRRALRPAERLLAGRAQ
jgi:hypothetical protein